MQSLTCWTQLTTFAGHEYCLKQAMDLVSHPLNTHTPIPHAKPPTSFAAEPFSLVGALLVTSLYIRPPHLPPAGQPAAR